MRIRRVRLATEFLRLVGSGRPKDGLRFFDSHYVTHNPFVIGGWSN